MCDDFSFPNKPTLRRQPFVYSKKDDPNLIIEVSTPEKGEMGGVTIKEVRSEVVRVIEHDSHSIESKIKKDLEIELPSPIPVEHAISVLSAANSNTELLRNSEENKSEVAKEEGEEGMAKNFFLVENNTTIAKADNDSLLDKIFYATEKVKIPYDPSLYPGVDYPNHEVEIPQEGHFIAGLKTLEKFSQELLKNMVYLIQEENKTNVPYLQLKRDLERATFYLQEGKNKRLLFEKRYPFKPEQGKEVQSLSELHESNEEEATSEKNSSSAPKREATVVQEKARKVLQPTKDPKDEAISNLETFVSNRLLARAIGSTMHQTLFTFLPDLNNNTEIVGLPRPSSQSGEGTQAIPEYTLEKKQETGSSNPFFIITATSTADVAGFTFKDQKNGAILTFLFGGLPEDRFLNFKQTASIAITLELKQNNKFDQEKPWSEENFPCHVKCLGYINVYNSHLIESSVKKVERVSGSQNLFNNSAKFVAGVSEKMSFASTVASEKAAATFQDFSEKASKNAESLGRGLKNVQQMMSGGIGGIFAKREQPANSLQQEKLEKTNES